VYVKGLTDEAEALRQALRNPIGSPSLREVIKAEDTVAIVFSDLTRPVPNSRILPVLLEELSHVPKGNITLINALGMHRPNTPDELREMLGERILSEYTVVQHEAHDKEHLVNLGVDSLGHEVWVNKEYINADKRILTGFIEPHFFAGFSGGPKSVLPGISGADLVMANHSAKQVGSPMATWGVTEGNPVHNEIREVAGMTKPSFILNVALNKDKEITAVFAGDIWQAHKEGTEFVRRTAMIPVDEPFDIVITTNSGYPLDLNLYQAVKGMTAALQVVKEGGAIISAAECCNGIPDHGNFKAILKMGSSPKELLDIINHPDFLMFDQWEAQLLAKILMKARDFLKAGYLSKEDIEGAHCIPVEDVAQTVYQLLEEYGPSARICVLPEGPQSVPYLPSH
jgi:nickel-dependent lactate racemase